MSSLLGFVAALAVGLASATSDDYNALPIDATCNLPGWYYFDGSCYLIDPVGTTNMIWQAADDFCLTANPAFPGSYLAEIMNEEEQEFVYYIVHTLQVMGEYNVYYWLGGNDLVHEGEWVWEHSGLPVNYTAWLPGRPDGGLNANCMAFYHGYSGTYNMWEDFTCEDDRWHPLCKAPFKPSASRGLGGPNK